MAVKEFAKGTVSEHKTKEGILVGPQIRQLTNYRGCDAIL